MSDSSPSSGYISEFSDGRNTGSSEVTASSVSTIDTFREFIEKHVQPFSRTYDLFATCYLCDDVPFDRIICEDSGSYKDIEVQFQEPVVLPEFRVQENSRRVIGPSIRKKFLVPSPGWVWNDLIYKRDFRDEGERVGYLYFKARQWCEVNKALTMDLKYPKPDPNVLRSRYSKPHQRAMRMVRKEMGMGRRDLPILSPEPVIPFPAQLVRGVLQEQGRGSASQELFYTSYDVGRETDEEQERKWREWKENLMSVFGDIQPLEELQTKETHWQSKAEESKQMRLKAKKKRFFKRNVYPPMAMEDYIREKRRLLPPIKPENLQTDYLSGIWRPELMVEDFEITPFNYDSRAEDGREVPDPISWWVIHESTQKCWQWLGKIPADL